ncbi:MAG: glycosyltransferase [Desulfobacteraceae bacterium]|nr:MAG: glycosyltransferase [Desulfobacteraceae bacterium]
MIPSQKTEPSADISDLLVQGETLFSRGDAVEAIQCFQNVLAEDPANGTALNNLGVIAFQLNDPALAEEFLVKAIRLNRRDPESLSNLADIYRRQGDLEKARALLFKAWSAGWSCSVLEEIFPEIVRGFARVERKKSTTRKILAVNNLFPPQELGGYGRIMSDYVGLLRQRGHEVEVLTSDTRALGEPPLCEPHVRRSLKLFGEWTAKGLTEYPRDRIMSVIAQNEQTLQEVLEHDRPDLCLVGNIDLLSVLIFRPIFSRGIPVLHRLGNEFIGYQTPDTPRDPLYRVATASQWLRDEAVRRGYPFQNAAVIHSGAFTREFQMVLPPATDSLRIVFSGLVNGYKGPQVLIEALHLLNEKKIPFTCTLAGGNFDARFVTALQARVKTLGLADQIAFAGFLNRAQLKDLYACHNVLVFPSLVPETFGISQVEAMAAGLLVVTSATGGAREVIEDGHSGLFFKPGNHRALADLLWSLPRDRERWERIALCGQQCAMEKFDIEQAVDKLEAVFKSFFPSSY